MNPLRVIEGQSASGNHTMDMGVVFEFLRPGVEDAKKADFGAEMAGGGGYRLEGLGAGVKQQIVEQFFVLQG
jgi:hypothetical protein